MFRLLPLLVGALVLSNTALTYADLVTLHTVQPEDGTLAANRPINRHQATGVRFIVQQETLVTSASIRLHHADNSFMSIFAALIQLTGEFDAPDSSDFSTSDVLAHVLIGPGLPEGSTPETRAATFSALLSPGYYAVVFGTGRFGALAGEVEVNEYLIPAMPSPFSMHGGNLLGDGPHWVTNNPYTAAITLTGDTTAPIAGGLTASSVVRPVGVPEPSTLLLTALGAVCAARYKRRRE